MKEVILDEFYKDFELNEINKDKYYVITFEYWYGCTSLKGHSFVQILCDENDNFLEFDSRKEANEFIRKNNLEDDFIVKKGSILRKLIKQDWGYLEKLGDGAWGTPGNAVCLLD